MVDRPSTMTLTQFECRWIDVVRTTVDGGARWLLLLARVRAPLKALSDPLRLPNSRL